MRQSKEDIVLASSEKYVHAEHVVQVKFRVQTSVKNWLDKIRSRGFPHCLQLNSGIESQILRHHLSYSLFPYHPTIRGSTV
jgi:hypothetical protein